MTKADLIRIPYPIPSRNTLDKMHWADKRRLQGNYRLFIRQQISKYKIVKWTTPTEGAIQLISIKRHKIRDYDNLVGGAKIMIDALVREEVIYDDTTELIGMPKIIQLSLKEWRGAIKIVHDGKPEDSNFKKVRSWEYWQEEHTSITRAWDKNVNW